MKWMAKRLGFVLLIATFQVIPLPVANAVTANTGAGGTFTYSEGSSNQQIALAACEAVNGVGNCRTGSCGNFTYYYKTSDGTCTCAKPVGSYEFIYNNTGYTSVGQDYGSTTNVSVNGNSKFVRKKNTLQCSVADVWLLVNSDLGAALNVSSTITVTKPSDPSYRTTAVITATGSVAGRITFYANNKKIPGCIKVVTNVSNVATCNWKPSLHGNQTLSAFLLPTSPSYLTSNSSNLTVFVTKRSSLR